MRQLDSCLSEQLSEVGTDAYDEVGEDWNGERGSAKGEGAYLLKGNDCAGCALCTDTGQNAAVDAAVDAAARVSPNFILGTRQRKAGVEVEEYRIQ